MTRRPPTGTKFVAAITALAGVGVSACASTDGRSPPASASSARPTAVVATSADDGRTLSLPVRGRLTVRLRNTYWHFQPVDDPAVLVGSRPHVSVPRQGHTIPGSGQGLVTETFTARGPGRTQVVATRTSCGEALRCTGGQGRFALTVVVR